MCGIAGLVNFSDPTQILPRLKTMHSALHHRGPDGDGEWIGEQAALLHTRLAIVDIVNGGQPFVSENGDAVLICNGEIYNHLELRTLLINRGHRFTSQSDNEVILHLYEEFPKEFPKYLKGMFAFALFDIPKKRLILGRDRMGQKPLFFEQNGRELSFASELGALRELRHGINIQALHNFFQLQYIPPPETIFLGIRQLLPGHILTFDLESCQLSCRRYWQINYSAKLDITLGDAAKILRQKVSEAVKRRLMSEVPLGGFLSGGLDSAVVAALMLENSDSPIQFCSIGFADRNYDESDNIAKTAKFLSHRYPDRVQNKIFNCSLDSLELLKKIAPFYGQPFADASMIPCYELSRITREAGLTVTLSGDGADEIFGGYERYAALELALKLHRFAPLANWWMKHGAKGGERSFSGRLRRFAAAVATSSERKYWQLASHDESESLRIAYGVRMLDSFPADPAEILLRCNPLLTSKDPVERAAELDVLTYLPGDVLTKVDIASMQYAQEVRSPFLDFDVVEFAAQLPWKFKQHGRERKILMKKAFYDLVHPDILNGKKRGFGVPVASLLRGSWRKEAMEMTIHGVAADTGFFSAKGVNTLWNRHLSEKSDESRTLFSILVFELFLRTKNC